ncbi:MAG: hypothetical protein P4L92_00610 [Rudaea sp.]|nr:hypothetical protein [Rudaea sp.]
MSSVIDDYLVDPKVSLLDKTRMQAQALLPELRAFRAELGREEADFDIASVGEGAVSLDRAQPLMQGAPSCTFRYRLAPR